MVLILLRALPKEPYEAAATTGFLQCCGIDPADAEPGDRGGGLDPTIDLFRIYDYVYAMTAGPGPRRRR